MDKKERGNFFKNLFSPKKSNCCEVTIEEVTEDDKEDLEASKKVGNAHKIQPVNR